MESFIDMIKRKNIDIIIISLFMAVFFLICNMTRFAKAAANFPILTCILLIISVILLFYYIKKNYRRINEFSEKNNFDLTLLFIFFIFNFPAIKFSQYILVFNQFSKYSLMARITIILFIIITVVLLILTIVHIISHYKRMVVHFKNNYYVLTSMLLFLSFPSYDVWILKGFPFFAWIALVPLFVYIRDRSYKEIYLVSFITGIFGNYLTYEWIGNFGAKVDGGFFVVLILLIPSLTVFFTLKIIISEILSRSFENLRFVIYPSVWIVVEAVQSIGFFAYPLPFYGYSQYPFIPFIQISSFIGIFGITFILILFNYFLSDLLYYKNKLDMPMKKIFKMIQTKRFIGMVIGVIVIIIYGIVILINSNKPIKKDLRIAMVQSCISPWEDWDNNRMDYLRELKKYTEESIKEKPDFIIWSESATLETIAYDYEKEKLNLFEMELLDFVRECNKPLLTGEIGVVESKADFYIRREPKNNAVLINRFGEVVKTYSKINLVPVGEWFPYDRWFPFVKDIIRKFGGSSFVPGDKPIIFELGTYKFGVLVCYEGIFHRLCRDYKNLGAQFFVNITNDGWTDTYNGHMQHFSATVFRAVENGIWFLRAGNTGYTVIMDPYGRIVKSIPILGKGYLVGDVDLSINHETFYSKYGDVFLNVSIGFLGVLFIMYFYYKFKRG